MGKPILFDTISRSKFDSLSDEIKAKKNYQIKEEDGKISKHIAGLEGGFGDVVVLKMNGEAAGSGFLYTSVNTVDEIKELMENGKVVFFDSVLEISESDSKLNIYSKMSLNALYIEEQDGTVEENYTGFGLGKSGLEQLVFQVDDNNHLYYNDEQ